MTHALRRRRHGNVTGTQSDIAPTPGNYLVTSIDAQVQKVAEDQLAAAIKRARVDGRREQADTRRTTADSGAVVVMDVKTGQIVAMASYPTYNPSVWVGGISQQGLQGDHEQAEQLPDRCRVPTRVSTHPGRRSRSCRCRRSLKSPGYSLYGSYDCPLEPQDRGHDEEELRVRVLPATSACRRPSRSPATRCSTGSPSTTGSSEGGVSAATRRARTRSPRWPRRTASDEKTGSTSPPRSAAGSFDRQGKYDYWKAIRERRVQGSADAAAGSRDSSARRWRTAATAGRTSTSPGEAANFAIGQGSHQR